jgi:hypothetical protein
MFTRPEARYSPQRLTGEPARVGSAAG